MNKYFLMLFVKGFAAVLLFTTSVLVSRTIGIEQFGVYSGLVSIVSVLTFICLWGTDRFCLKKAFLTNS